MPPNPSPTPLDVFVHSGPAEWWQIVAALGPLAVLLGAVIAWFTLRQRSKSDRLLLTQKAEADNRSEWWKRTQWALDAVYSGDKRKTLVGLKVLGVLGESELAGAGELAVLEAAWEKPLSDAEQSMQDDWQVEIESKLPSDARTAVGQAVDVLNEPGDNGTDVRTDEPGGGRP
jgi:hypothetical protein